MSRGPGRCQRRIIELLESTPGRRANRAELDAVLVGSEAFDESNLLRAIKSLARNRYVIFRDAHRKEHSVVQLPPKIEPVPETTVFEVLAEIGDRR